MAVVAGSVLRTPSQAWRRIMLQSATIPAVVRQMSTSETIRDKKLDGKVAIITGAASGIGATTAKLFTAHGAQVIVADIADENGNKVCSGIGSNAHYRHCDVRKEQDVASTVDFAVEKFGKLDILFNNAGIATPPDTFESLDIEGYDRHTSTMVRGVLVGIKHASRVMIPVKQGVILNTASVASVTTGKNIPIVYNISKTNIPGMTRIAAYHLGKHGIRVNTVSPHAILTKLLADMMSQCVGRELNFEEMEEQFVKNSNLVGKTCTDDDIAKGALFLCSDDSGYISGQNLIIDGGWSNSKDYNVVEDLISLGKK